MTLTIIEGPNCAGKTTLAKALKPEMIVSAGPPTSANGYQEYVGRIFKTPFFLDTMLQGNVVCDRWHIGERIYAKLFERDPILTVMERDRITRGLKALFDMKIVLLLPSLEVLLSRFRERGDELVKTESMLIREHNEYDLISQMPWVDELLTTQDEIDTYLAGQ